MQNEKQFNERDIKSINPDELRLVLSEQYKGQGKFDLNEMADATECYELLLANIQNNLIDLKGPEKWFE